jgi:4-diphosphocytidyl-2-C-methyl-D-erythritol kinase
VRTRAPAKINWTLEVLGRREDGYHEIRSVMQTIDLCDEVEADRSDWWVFEAADKRPLPEDDLVVRAARALERRVGRPLAAQITLQKRIPVASVLGGGSSDAAAVLRLLNRLYALGLSTDELSTVGASVGSDVPFFVYGETALVEGRGECVTSLPQAAKAWLVLVVPRIRLQDKTKRMYEAISVEDFSDGSRGQALSQQLRKGKAVQEDDLYNVFERAARKTFDGLDAYRDALMSAGANTVHLTGAGPALFVLAESEAVAREMAQRIQTPHAKVFFAPTIEAQEATAVTD